MAYSTGVFKDDDPDLFVRIVNARQAVNAYEKSLKASLEPASQRYEKSQKEVNKDTIRLIKVMICAAAASLGAAMIVSNASKKNEVNRITQEIAAPIENNIHYTGNVDENGNRIWYIDDYQIVQDFKDQDKYSVDEEIFASYRKLYGKYHFKESLNKYVKDLTGLTNFEEYLKSKGYDDNEKQWVKDMSRLLLDKYSQKQSDTLEFQEANMGGR